MACGRVVLTIAGSSLRTVAAVLPQNGRVNELFFYYLYKSQGRSHYVPVRKRLCAPRCCFCIGLYSPTMYGCLLRFFRISSDGVAHNLGIVQRRGSTKRYGVTSRKSP